MLSWFKVSLHANKHSQPRCSNIRRLEALVREAKYQHTRETEPIKLHSGWQELDKCAHDGCAGCRVVRQAVLLDQITNRQVQKLEARDDPVYVRLQNQLDSGLQPSTKSTIQVILGVPPLGNVGGISIALTSNVKSLALPEKRLDLVVPQIKGWLDNCRQGHQRLCGNLSWSRENPRRLIEIVSESRLRLIDSAALPLVDYVALSYCWGDGGTFANTIWTNLNIRQQGFSMDDVPATIRDALLLVKRLNLKYLWVDQICIVQNAFEGGKTVATGEDWDLEGSRMHIVYGNAVFTLSACSSESSIDGLFQPRKAWTYPVVPFYLEGHWLVNFDASLSNVRARAPLSNRAWVLQEERLSPRMLFYCGQRVYWSCSVDRHAELPVTTTRYEHPSGRPVFDNNGNGELGEVQAFLNLRFDGNKKLLHLAWQEIVHDYCLRNMTQSNDRFRAISGLAAQYLSVFVTKDNKIWGQEYLAGLWRATFAEDLAWSVSIASDPRIALVGIAPSWSWASLPLQTPMDAIESFEPDNDFELVGALDSSITDNLYDLNPGALVREACRIGALVRGIRIRGRMQRIMNDQSEEILWLETQAGTSGQAGYAFEKYTDKHVYARHENGKVVIHEPNKQALECQLDYSCPTTKEAGIEPVAAIAVSWNSEKGLFGLRISLSTMLLLSIVPPAQEELAASVSMNETSDVTPMPRYRRVGLCRRFREGFFDGVAVKEIVLE